MTQETGVGYICLGFLLGAREPLGEAGRLSPVPLDLCGSRDKLVSTIWLGDPWGCPVRR